MREKCSKLREIISDKWKKYSFLGRPFLTMLLIYLLGVSAIILAGVHYADDVARTTYGYAEWAGFSRYINTVASHFLHADWYLTNIAPWPQLLAIIILASASILLICIVMGADIFKQKWTKWIWPIIAVVPLGLNPYMLECLSYQYDAVYMAISILFAILPMVFWRGRSLWALGGMTIVGVLVVCMTYQASIGLFPVLVVFMIVKMWGEKEIKNKEILKKVFVATMMFLLTLVVFQKFLMRPRDAYASNNVPEISNFFPMLFEHLKQYFELIISDFRTTWKVLIGLISAIFMVIYVLRSKRNKILALIVSCVALVAMAVMSLIIYAALEKPLYAPRAMFAVGGVVAVVCIYVVGGTYSKWVTKIPVFVLTYCLLMFALTYGNALREQNDYRNSRVEMVLMDLNRLPIMLNGEEMTVQVDGEIGLSPVIKNMPINDYRLLYRLLMPSFGDHVPWMAYRITEQRWLNNIHNDFGVNLDSLNLPLLKETMLYDIFGDEKNILVKFKNEKEYDLLY